MPRDLGLSGAKTRQPLCARDTSNGLVSGCSYLFQYGRVGLRIIVTVKSGLVVTISPPYVAVYEFEPGHSTVVDTVPVGNNRSDRGEPRAATRFFQLGGPWQLHRK